MAAVAFSNQPHTLHLMAAVGDYVAGAGAAREKLADGNRSEIKRGGTAFNLYNARLVAVHDKAFRAGHINCSTLVRRVYVERAETLACFNRHDHPKYRHARAPVAYVSLPNSI